jgi:hypothetical protein
MVPVEDNRFDDASEDLPHVFDPFRRGGIDVDRVPVHSSGLRNCPG